MQYLADLDVERGGRPVGEHGIVARNPRRADQREQEAACEPGDQHKGADEHGSGLRAQRVDEHPGVVQRDPGCDAPHDESPSGHLMAGNKPAPVGGSVGVLVGGCARGEGAAV